MKSLAHLRILVIDRDPDTAESLRACLLERGHTVAVAATVEDGQRLMHDVGFDGVILDAGLPGAAEWKAVRPEKFRANRPALMVLRGAPPGNGETGAEDRIETPVSLVELEMRIVTAVRRYRAEAEEHFSFGPYRLDIHKRRLFCEKTEVGITRSEYLLLRTLAMNRGNIVSRRQLMQAVWGTATMIHGALDALVNAVRIKLKDEKPGLISAVAGVGYALLENAEAMKLAGSAGKSRNTPRKVSAEQKEDAPTA